MYSFPPDHVLHRIFLRIVALRDSVPTPSRLETVFELHFLLGLGVDAEMAGVVAHHLSELLLRPLVDAHPERPGDLDVVLFLPVLVIIITFRRAHLELARWNAHQLHAASSAGLSPGHICEGRG